MTTRYFVVMMLVVAIVALASPATLSAAAGSAGTRTITPTISAVTKTFTKTIPHPKPASEDRLEATIDISFPVLSSSKGTDAGLEAINKEILAKLIGMIEGDKATTPEQVMETFEKDFLEAMQEETEMIGGWSLKFEAAIKYADEDLISLDILESTFTGGAHPLSNITYLVFSLKTGKPIELAAIVPETKRTDLTRIAEPHFRQTREMKPDESYPEAGFTFDNDTFTLNRNFLVSPSGLAFCFNQYEIGPYALGVTELVIPWSDLKPLVDPKGLAGRFLSK
jgi:hypothetical protein